MTLFKRKGAIRRSFISDDNLIIDRQGGKLAISIVSNNYEALANSYNGKRELLVEIKHLEIVLLKRN